MRCVSLTLFDYSFNIFSIFLHQVQSFRICKKLLLIFTVICMLTKYFGAQKYFAVFSKIYFIDMFQEDLEDADLITVGVEDVKSVKRVRKLQVRKPAGKNVGFPNLCSHFNTTLVTFSLGMTAVKRKLYVLTMIKSR